MMSEIGIITLSTTNEARGVTYVDDGLEDHFLFEVNYDILLDVINTFLFKIIISRVFFAVFLSSGKFVIIIKLTFNMLHFDIDTKLIYSC